MHHHYGPEHPFAGLSYALAIHDAGIVHKHLDLASSSLGLLIYLIRSIDL